MAPGPPGPLGCTAGPGTAGQNVVAGDDLTITTTGDVTNNAVIYAADGTSGGGGLVIDAGGQIINNAAKNIYGAGDVVLVSNSRITNNSAAYIEAGDDLTLAVVTGETISGGGITGGTKVANGYILNTQGIITSADDASFVTSAFYNMRAVSLAGSGPWTVTADDTTTTVIDGSWQDIYNIPVRGGSEHNIYRKNYSTEARNGTTASN